MSEARERSRSERVFAFFQRVVVAVAVLIPLLITLDRFRRPTGEKFVFENLAGSADLWLPFNGARALVMGIDPYMTPLPPELRDPSNWPNTYPPTMELLYVPLVLVTDGNIEKACQIFYWLNIVALGALTFFVWRLALSLRERTPGDSLATALVLLIALTLNTGTMFALDRGQSEIINAALCWGAAWLFTKKHVATAMALITLAAGIKGYAAIFAIGLLLAAPSRKQFLRGVLSAGLVALALTVPVAAHLMTGLNAMRTRSGYFFFPVWYNHSFKSLFYHLTPAGSDAARAGLLAFTALVVALACWRLSVAGRGADEAAIPGRSVVLASSALGLMVGLPVYSAAYNFLLVLPGLLLVALRIESFASTPKLKLALALTAPVALAFALMMRGFGQDGPLVGLMEVPLAGIALVYLLLLAGILSLAKRLPVADPVAG